MTFIDNLFLQCDISEDINGAYASRGLLSVKCCKFKGILIINKARSVCLNI